MKAFISVPKGRVFNKFFTPEVVRFVEELGEIVWYDGDQKMTEQQLVEAIGDCDVYVALWGSPALSERVLAAAPRLRLLTALGSTVVPYISDAMWGRGIRVISGFHYYSESTAEGAIAYMLSALRRIPHYSGQLRREGVWEAHGITDGLIYKTVGIVGYGGVGRHIVRMLSTFNVRLKVYDIKEIPSAECEQYGFVQCGLEELCATCDVISLHLPYNESTHHLIDDRLMSMMKKDALLVNTARGGVIDQAALTRHLQSGNFRAALDVLEKEPIERDDPLLQLDNVLITPHQAGVTSNLCPILTQALLQESADYIDLGTPLKNEITREYAKGMSNR